VLVAGGVLSIVFGVVCFTVYRAGDDASDSSDGTWEMWGGM
jgi:hypothetical protein